MKDKKESEKQGSYYMPLCMCMGMSIGMAIGAASGNITIGMCIGMSMGIAIGSMIDARNRKKVEENNQSEEKKPE